MDSNNLKALFSATSAVRTRAESRRLFPGAGFFKSPPVQPLSGLLLIDALLIAAEELGHFGNREQMLAALPQQGNDLNPIAAQLALARIDLHAQWQHDAKLPDLPGQFPYILSLKSGGYVVVLEDTQKNFLRLRAAGFHGVYRIDALNRQAGTSFLPVSTQATADARSRQRTADNTGYLAACRAIWSLTHVKVDVSATSMIFAFIMSLLGVGALLSIVFAISTLGQGSLVTIPITAALSSAYLWLVNWWRKQRIALVAPALVSALRSVFLRGSLLRQTLGSENHGHMARETAIRFLGMIRTPVIDLPVAVAAAGLAYLTSPGWMIEIYVPSLLIGASTLLKMLAARRHAKSIVRLCHAIRFVSTNTLTRLRGDLALDQATVTADDNRILLNSVTLRIRAGERIGIMGDMSSGKSMLLKALGGIVALDDGRRYVDGQPLVHETDPHRSNQVFYAPAEPIIIDGTLSENIFLGRPVPQPGMMQWIVRLCGMDAFWDRMAKVHPACLLTAQTLSSAEKQGLGLVRALAGDPAILLLDEPTAYMTGAAEATFLSSLLNDTTRRTILVASNRESVLKTMDRIITINNGCIVSDKSRESYVRHKPDYRNLSA
jgi:ABC-type bacteriocin/lantibiotic exporter with double-glycine peptidase domain